MPVREFRDSGGVSWRAWNITPESIHPITKAEDYLADCYQLGWLVFETKSGSDKRRLCPYPPDWDMLPEQALEQLLRQSEIVPARKHARASQSVHTRVPQDASDRHESAPRNDHQHVTTDERPSVADLDVVRSFRYPGGRLWTVCVLVHPADGPPVLRFSAGTRTIDLKDWPKDWVDLLDDQLVELLRQAAPRHGAKPPGEDTPRRRYDDPAPERPPQASSS